MKKVIFILCVLIVALSTGCSYAGESYFSESNYTNDSIFGESSFLRNSKEPFQSNIDYILADYNVKDVSDATNNTIAQYDFIDSDITLVNNKSATDDTASSAELEVVKETQKETSKGSSGAKIVAYARKFVGKPYNYGGGHNPQWNGSMQKFPKTGVDCSAFVSGIYTHFGYKISGTAQNLTSFGKKIDTSSHGSWKAGDLIMFGTSANNIGHVAIYTGNGKLVHALGKKWGIVETPVNYGPSSNVVAARRILK